MSATRLDDCGHDRGSDPASARRRVDQDHAHPGQAMAVAAGAAGADDVRVAYGDRRTVQGSAPTGNATRLRSGSQPLPRESRARPARPARHLPIVTSPALTGVDHARRRRGRGTTPERGSWAGAGRTRPPRPRPDSGCSFPPGRSTRDTLKRQLSPGRGRQGDLGRRGQAAEARPRETRQSGPPDRPASIVLQGHDARLDAFHVPREVVLLVRIGRDHPHVAQDVARADL